MQAADRYAFTRRDLEQIAGRSAVAIDTALRRLMQRGRIQASRRGLFVIVPVGCRAAG